MKPILLGSVAALAMTTAAYGQDNGGSPRQWPFVGNISIEGGINYFDDITVEDDGSGSYLRGDANLLWHKPNTRYAIGLNGMYRNENLTGSEQLDEAWAPANQWEIGAKLYRILSRRARVGLFAAYGKENFEEPDHSIDPIEAISHVILGVESQYLIDDDFLLFGQAAVGDSWGGYFHDNGYSHGFGRGYVVRGGVTWFGCYDSAVTLDVEMGGAANFTEAGNSADFTQVALYGETRLPVDMPLFVGYGFRHRMYSSATYNESSSETEGFLRLSYVWGANSPRDRWLDGDALGNPMTPARAGYHGLWLYWN